MGVLYEIAGAANEAEYVFQEGLNISNAQDLPLCQAAFGSSLGIYFSIQILEFFLDG